VPERRGRPGDAGIADQNINLAVTLMQRCAQTSDALIVGQVERHQRSAAAILADLVVEFLKPALCPRHSHDMRAGLSESTRGSIADAARGAGDESDTGGEGFGHGEVRINKYGVTRGLDPRIHLKSSRCQMDCRVKPGNDKASAGLRQQR
jgi:hypothetical protein